MIYCEAHGGLRYDEEIATYSLCPIRHPLRTILQNKKAGNNYMFPATKLL
jgi:hypothetical protein